VDSVFLKIKNKKSELKGSRAHLDRRSDLFEQQSSGESLGGMADGQKLNVEY
jgi:hypothetical protein